MTAHRDAHVQALRLELIDFVDHEVIPVQRHFRDIESGERAALLAELQAEACRRGLWNLLSLDPQAGPGLGSRERALLAVELGRSPLALAACGGLRGGRCNG